MCVQAAIYRGVYRLAFPVFALLSSSGVRAQELNSEAQAVPVVASFPSICNYCIQMEDIGIKLRTGGMRVLNREALSPSRGAFFQWGSVVVEDGSCAVHGVGLSIEAEARQFSVASVLAHHSAVAEAKAGGGQNRCYALELWPFSPAESSWKNVVKADRACLGSVVQLPTFLFVDPSNGLRLFGGLRGNAYQQISFSRSRQLPPYPTQNVCDGKLVSVEQAATSRR